jgi:uroporphyrin-III C-methyltransferase
MDFQELNGIHGPEPGEVWMVGAGPGDPGLITRQGALALRCADLILHDALLDPAGFRRLFRRGAVVVDVGKRKGLAPVPQAEICARLVAAALAGLRVVRLKAGDPLLFARGGEELDALADAGVPVRIVPGVSAALAAPAAARIAVSRRGIASAVTVLTGHDETGATARHDWAALRRTGATLVLLMGVTELPRLAQEMLRGGFAPDTPVAIVGRASVQGERSARLTLRACADAGVPADMPRPATIVIGQVVGAETFAPSAASANSSHPREPEILA